MKTFLDSFGAPLAVLAVALVCGAFMGPLAVVPAVLMLVAVTR